MASIVTYDGGLRRIECSHTPNGPRRMIRLGRMSAKAAETVKAKMEAIIGDKFANRPHDAEISKWLGGLDETMLAKLRVVGLAEGVGLAETSWGAFLKRFMATLAGKQSTRIAYGNTVRNLERYFGAERAIRSITTADADAWRAWLVQHE